MNSRYVRFLEEGGEAGEIGGKGASLAGLRRAGFPIPEGFCVTADAYRAFVEASGLEEALDLGTIRGDSPDRRAVESASADLRQLLLGSPLPPDLVSAVSAAYLELARRLGRQPAVAVRSSAVSEDSGTASFAGLYETYLNLGVEGDVLEALHKCFASLWTARALQYRAAKGLESATEAMAVVVLEMVPARTSGITFTLNPVTGDRGQVVINSSWGLGEAVVSGRVTPDSFTLDRESLAILHREVSEKHLAVYPAADGASGTSEEHLEPPLATAASLSDEEVVEVARLALRVEEHYGRPQDVEWASTGQALYLLQSRPVTTA